MHCSNQWAAIAFGSIPRPRRALQPCTREATARSMWGTRQNSKEYGRGRGAAVIFCWAPRLPVTSAAIFCPAGCRVQTAGVLQPPRPPGPSRPAPRPSSLSKWSHGHDAASHRAVQLERTVSIRVRIVRQFFFILALHYYIVCAMMRAILSRVRLIEARPGQPHAHRTTYTRPRGRQRRGFNNSRNNHAVADP